jgi:Rrf2 family transcriptional regulator, nitric oxide-sensitive transcriptional repressor
MKRFINISEGALIAIHGLILIARAEDTHASSRYISEKTGASCNTVSKVMQRLVKAKFIESERGPRGGFTLIKAASQVSLYDVLTVIEGEPEDKECIFDAKECPIGECIFGGTYKKISNDFTRYLKDQKLSQYVD